MVVLNGIHGLWGCSINEEFAFLTVIIGSTKTTSSSLKRNQFFFTMESTIISISSFGSSSTSEKIYDLYLIILCYVVIWNLQ